MRAAGDPANKFRNDRMRMRACILLLALIAGCSSSNDANVEDLVDDLVDALNRHDQGAASQLFTEGRVEPLTSSSDSSVIYRLLTIPGGNDFEASNIETVVAGDQGRATFDLTGTVRHGDSVAGTMTLNLQYEVEKGAQGWKFVAGSESQRTGF